MKKAKLFFKSITTVFKVNILQSSILIILTVIQGLIPAASVKLSALIIDSITEFLKSSNNLEIFWLCILWGGSLLVHNLIEPWILFLQRNIGDLAVHKINLSIINKSNKIEGLAIFQNKEFHDDLQIIQSQSPIKPINLTVTAVGLLKDLSAILGYIVILYTQTFYICFLALISAYVNSKVFSSIQKQSWQESLRRSPRSRFMGYISSVSINPIHAQEIRFFNLGRYLKQYYSHIFHDIYQYIFTLRLKQIILSFLPLFFSISCSLIAFYLVLQKALVGNGSIGDLVLLLQSLAQLHICISSFGEQSGWVTGHLLFFEKYFNFLLVPEKVYPSLSVSKKIPNFSKGIKICFDNVSFVYPDGREALSNLSFTINFQKKVALIGPNGSGKSTLIKLLCGFYAPTSGTILINNQPISTLDLEAWRKKISPVFQDFSPYYLSVKQNIIMGSPILNKTKFNRILKDTNLSNLVKDLREGIEHPLGTQFGGTNLSNGQLQRILIARALYKDALIYILDEPTSALDINSENHVFKVFNSLPKEALLIFITHSLTKITMFDHVLLLEKGKLVAQGSPQELKEKSEEFKEMINFQDKENF